MKEFTRGYSQALDDMRNELLDILGPDKAPAWCVGQQDKIAYSEGIKAVINLLTESIELNTDFIQVSA